MPPPRITDIVAEGAVRFAGRPALRDGERVLDYRALARSVEEVASHLHATGLRPGDRALVVAGNAVETIVLVFAIARCDAWPVLATARLADAEIDAIAAHAEPRLALYVPRHSSEAAAHGARRGARATGVASLAILVERFAGEPAREPAPAGGVAAMLYTSGTTGAPKAAVLTHANVLFLARAQAVARRYRADDRVYLALPVAFAGALASISLTTLVAGGCLHLAPRFDAAELLRALREDGITVVPGVPALHMNVIEYARSHAGAFAAPHLRMVTSASSPLDAAVKAGAEALYGIALQNGYGLTETTAVVCQSALDEPRADTSVGRPLHGVRIRVADGDGRDVAPGETGEILVRGPNVFAGYYRDAAATRAAFTADGWFRTGDLGRAEPSGALHLTGRLRNVIKRFGYTVHPDAVEGAIATHPAVAACAVVGRPRGADEAIVAFVQLREHARLGVRELATFLEGRLARHERPGTVRFVEAMPRTASGKVDRATLARLAREGAAG